MKLVEDVRLKESSQQILAIRQVRCTVKVEYLLLLVGPSGNYTRMSSKNIELERSRIEDMRLTIY